MTGATTVATFAATTAVLLSTFAGCTVGPEYAKPDLSTQLSDTFLASDSAAASDPAQLAEWWTAFEDPELATLVERALAQSLNLAEARERIIEARARRGIDNADRLPTLDAQGSYQRLAFGEDSLAFNGPPGGGNDQRVDVYSLGVVAGWELDLWGRVARLVEAADADIEFAIEDFRAARVALAAEVAREVVLIRAIDRDLTLVRATIEADRESLEIAASRERAGFSNALAGSRAQRRVEANLAVIPGLEADRRAAELRLAVLLAEPPAASYVTDLGLPDAAPVPALGVPAELLLRRPDLRRAERELAAATARIGAAQAEWYPRVSLSGSLALQGPDLGDTVNPDAYVFGLGPSISLPIFEGGRIDSQIAQAESRQRQALLRLQRAAIDAIAEVETAAMRRVKAEERADRLASATEAAELTESLSLDRFRAGAVDFLDVTEARTQRLAIERDRTLAQRDSLLRLIDLYAALGGGWSEPNPAPDSTEASLAQR